MPPDAQNLLLHAEWVHALARRLVRDPRVAEDLAQDTLVTVLRWRGDAISSMRGFLRTVLTNRIREHARGNQRRKAREERTAGADASPSTASLVARASVQREVVEAVLSLPEIYRDVLLWRYFEDLTPTGISERLHIPVSTIKTRLTKAHELMRERLDKLHGNDGKTWIAALAPLLPKTNPPVPIAAVGSKALIAVVIVLIGVTVYFARGVLLESPESHPVPTTELSATTTPEPRTERAEIVDRVEEPATNDLADSWVPFSAATSRRGRVVDLDGSPLASIVVQHQAFFDWPSSPGSAIAVSDPAGNFELQTSPSPGQILVASEDFVTVFAGVDGGGEVLVVAAKSCTIEGVVRDPRGRPIPDAAIDLELPREIRHHFSGTLENAWPVLFFTQANSEGRFKLGGVPLAGEITLITRKEGWESVESAVPGPNGSPHRWIDITLDVPGQDGPVLVGTCIDNSGDPIAGARISDGQKIYLTDELGYFRVPIRDSGTSLPTLTAVHPGLLPTRWMPPTTFTGDPITLRLTGRPKSMSGHVRDPDGRPIAGAKVWVEDPTVLANSNDDERGIVPYRYPLRVHDRPRILEDLIHPTTSMPTETSRDDLDRTAARRSVTTDSEGWFQLNSLCDREYALVAMDPSTCVRSPVTRSRAGRDDLLLTLDRNDAKPIVDGVVRLKNGAPVAGATVTVYVRSVGTILKSGTKTTGMGSVDDRFAGEVRIATRRRTSRDGRFRLVDVPRDHATLSIRGRGIAPHDIAISHLPVPLVIEAAASARIQILTTDGSEADRFRALDDQGRPIQLYLPRGEADFFRSTSPIIAGSSEVVTVPAETRRIELLSGSASAGFVEIYLLPNQLNIVRP